MCMYLESIVLRLLCILESAHGVVERVINVRYYYYYYLCHVVIISSDYGDTFTEMI